MVCDCGAFVLHRIPSTFKGRLNETVQDVDDRLRSDEIARMGGQQREESGILTMNEGHEGMKAQEIGTRSGRPKNK